MNRMLCLLLVLPVMAVDMPDRGEVDRLRAGIGERSGNGEPTLLAACAFGYAACGDAAKAEECAAEIRKRFPSSQALKLLEPGFVTTPCPHCYGIPVRCARCDGKGELVTMVGSKPVKCIICNGSGLVKPNCKVCKDTNSDPMSKEACAKLFLCIVADKGFGIALESESYIKYLMTSINLAKRRMRIAVRITGSVVRQGSGGMIVRPAELLWKDGAVETGSLVFIETPERVSDGSSVSLVAFGDGTHEYADSYGNVRVIDRYLTSHWDGALKPYSMMPADTTVRGIPKSVYEKIRSKAEREWPDNFSMQKYVIGKEIEAYKDLHR